MDEPELPQLYLISPSEITLSTFPDQLAAILDAVEIACMRMALSSTDEDVLMKTGDTLREIAHARDVPLVISEHVLLAERIGLDGVHLTDGARTVRFARKTLGNDAIVGAFCENSQHDGMTAGESGADYIAFGPVAETSLGDGKVADTDLFKWWSETIEVPVIAEGGLSRERVETLAPVTDFFAIGPEIWGAEDPKATLLDMTAALR